MLEEKLKNELEKEKVIEIIRAMATVLDCKPAKKPELADHLWNTYKELTGGKYFYEHSYQETKECGIAWEDLYVVEGGELTRKNNAMNRWYWEMARKYGKTGKEKPNELLQLIQNLNPRD